MLSSCWRPVDCRHAALDVASPRDCRKRWLMQEEEGAHNSMPSANDISRSTDWPAARVQLAVRPAGQSPARCALRRRMGESRMRGWREWGIFKFHHHNTPLWPPFCAISPRGLQMELWQLQLINSCGRRATLWLRGALAASGTS